MMIEPTKRRHLPPLVPALFAGAIGCILALLSDSDVISERSIFFGLTVLLLLYLLLEVNRLRRVHPQRWLLNPAVMASFLTFGLSFGAGNFLFLLPGSSLAAFGLIPEVTSAMVKLMWLTLLGAIAMWLGYWSTIASKIAGPSMQAWTARWISPAKTSRPLALPIVAGIALAARFVQIKLGLFGYSSSYERLAEMGPILQYLAIGASLGRLALVLAAMDYYSEPTSKRRRMWFFALLVVEIFFGFVSGFKSQIAMPLVIVGVCRYLHSGRLPTVWFAGFLLALTIGYSVIEPFRDARNERADFQGTTVTEIVDTLISSQAAEGNKANRSQEPSVWLSVLARSSLVYVGSLGIEYKDQHQDLPEGSPRFLANMLLSPIYAWVPRAIWTSKPVGDLGLWYTQVVMGRNLQSATAPSAMTYLYFAGGALAIIVVFFALGVGQRALLFLTQPDTRPAGAIVFLAMLPMMSNVESSVDGSLVFVFRMLPLLMVFQHYVYSRPGRR